MARFLYWSDLHTEFAPFAFPDPREVGGLSAVLFGGDTAVGDTHLDVLFTAWKHYGVPVFSVRGNHEYYNQVWEDQEARDAKRLAAWHAAGVPIHVLSGDTAVVDGVRIVGATLWTDMRLMGDGGVMAIPAIRRDMQDYKKIHVLNSRGRDPDFVDARPTRKLEPTDTIARHMTDRDALFAALAEPWDGPTLVMTHHMPTPLLVSPAYKNDLASAAFASDLTLKALDANVDIWLSGHTHTMTRSPVELERPDRPPLRFFQNIRGYPFEAEPMFDPRFVIVL